jgi:hypothetical protein
MFHDVGRKERLEQKEATIRSEIRYGNLRVLLLGLVLLRLRHRNMTRGTKKRSVIVIPPYRLNNLINI